MARLKTNTGLPAQKAIHRGEGILERLESDGADFVCVDDTHAYVWHREQLVNLYDHRELMNFLKQHGYLKPRTKNKMIIAAWIIFEAIQRCA